MLPENSTEARKVLGLTLELVDGFLAADGEAEIVQLQPEPRPDPA